MRALWHARDKLARQRDRAPSRILPDSAIINAVLADARTEAQLQALPVFSGRVQRRYANTWLRPLQSARVLPAEKLPSPSPASNGPPPANRWPDKAPDAAARLAAARTALAEIAERHQVPMENLLLPDRLRRLCWEPPEDLSEAGVAAALREGGARAWQVELTVSALHEALRTTLR